MTAYGFIGLGHQGTPMAERMIAAGLRPWLWARRPEVLERYRGSDARLASSPAEVGANSDVIGLCLFDAEATDAVLFGQQGLFSGIRPGTVLAVHATVGPRYMEALAARVPDGVRVVDAPVSGGDDAVEGKLLVMAGGDDASCEACAPMFATYAGTVLRLGEVGTAQATKLLNNALMTAITGLVFDAFELGDQLGIDRDGLGAVLASGSAANPSIGHYLALGGAEEFSIRGWPTLHKDIALAQELAADTTLIDALLLPTAAATIEAMARLRADYVRAKDAP